VLAKLLQSLNSAAIRDHLTQDPPVQTGELYQFELRRAGVPVLEIEIVTRTPLASSAGVKNSGEIAGSARLAIIIDDLGSDRAVAQAVFALGFPLTISVLPNHEHSMEIAEEAHRRGLQVMLHLPMQSVANETPEAQELRPGMPAQEVAQEVDQFLQNVPDVTGVNNHQGSQATADAALMDELMPVLRDHHLFYVDSRTTAATVAYEAAQDFGVPSAFRTFLSSMTSPRQARSANSSNLLCEAPAKRERQWQSAIRTPLPCRPFARFFLKHKRKVFAWCLPLSLSTRLPTSDRAQIYLRGKGNEWR